jgi:protein-S-isoprenylcysteine O-methyltransferase Ste14
MRKRVGVPCGAAIALTGPFWIAGTPAWWNAWAFLAFMVPLGVLTSRLIKNSPGLAEERRTGAAKTTSRDLQVVRLINAALPAMVVVASFDERFRWFHALPAAVSIAAFAMMVPPAILTYRAIDANRFFSSYVRIQEDRRHTVVSTGPYRAVRHPGYAGSAVFNLLVPLALGSWPAVALGLGAAVLLVYRTAKEDRVLMADLPGYSAYAQQVRYRLIPGMW